MISLSGFTDFVRAEGVSTTVLPDDSLYLSTAYDIASSIVNTDINLISSIIYDLSVYNLGMDNLINFAQDVTGQTYWADIRKQFNVNSFVAGVIKESNDETTGQTIETPEYFKQMSLINLQNLKTPYGRVYMQYSMQYGGVFCSV